MPDSKKVVLCGYHNMGCIALRILKELGVEVRAVLTHQDDPSETRWFDSLAERAREYGVPVYFSEDINHTKWIRLLKKLSPDLLLSCYFRRMMGTEILSIPRIAALNLHGSLLPRYRGRCPVNWQILHGEKKGGVTLHHMVKEPDAGDIVGQKEVEISEKETPVSLFSKLESAAEILLRESIPQVLEGTAPRIPQDSSKATYFGGRSPEDGEIDWAWPARRIYNLVRAVTWPYPGAFTSLGGRKLMVWWAEPHGNQDTGLGPGTLIHQEGQWVVQTGSGLIRVVKAGLVEDGPEGNPDLGTMLEVGRRLGAGKE